MRNLKRNLLVAGLAVVGLAFSAPASDAGHCGGYYYQAPICYRPYYPVYTPYYYAPCHTAFPIAPVGTVAPAIVAPGGPAINAVAPVVGGPAVAPGGIAAPGAPAGPALAPNGINAPPAGPLPAPGGPVAPGGPAPAGPVQANTVAPFSGNTPPPAPPGTNIPLASAPVLPRAQ